MDLAGQTKGETRRRLRAHRRHLAASRDLGADAEAIADAIVGATPRGGTSSPGTVLSYESLPHEPPTTALNACLQAAGHRVLVPTTLPDRRLEWCDLSDPERSPLGIDAPAAADVAVIPALAVDTTGTRLGQGGGCYDRVLPMLPAGTPVLVLLHPGEHTSASLPRDPHDVAVTTVVTAAGVTEAGTPLRP
ncbi:5-formyltetrahydrofolate cyclo-ligase [Janibacter cremeus]|uniref:5-formyltetrahydrofolate cyclo-ligase n=1 Tax=Janibacter cremeus TaxID=1285192 RepID=A0A852VQU8_9MICO|nr:5-formyltetrahydrofolate cyclo-ligase [Janibacter cremeus]NYF97810.1 5-formyltetrahydrofolate cyclo-ligase [Janibacter cremeus]